MDVDQRLYRRVMMLVARGRVKVTDDTGAAQLAQVDFGPTSSAGSLSLQDNVPVISLFGHTSNPPADSDVIAISLGGDRNKTVAIGHSHQTSRLKNLGVGDSALYDVRGAYVWFKPTGLVIDAAGGNVTIQNAGNISITASGNVTVTAQHVIVNSSDVELGATGGQPVARVGDTVSGGVITSGSSKVKAA
jgi:phage gp45-like